MNDFCAWDRDGIVESYKVFLARSTVTVYCQRPVTEDQVRAYCTQQYSMYGGVLSVAKVSVPTYCNTGVNA